MLYGWDGQYIAVGGIDIGTCGSNLFFDLEAIGIVSFTGNITSVTYAQKGGTGKGNFFQKLCGSPFMTERTNTDWWTDERTAPCVFPDSGSIYLQYCESEEAPVWYQETWQIYGSGTCGLTYTEQSLYDTCATVSDHHFTGAVTDTWLLSGSAAISNSILTLPAGDAAGQNLTTLASNTDYNAVVSVTNEVTASLLVVLGIETDTLSITGPGIYTASLTTPNLGGPVAYILESQPTTSATLEIDLTCLYSTADEDERVCLAPDNGEFVGADDWDWYRGAAYQTLLENAYLPYNEGAENTKSLVMASATYTLPTLETGESLLLSFESETQYNQAGVLGARVDAGITDTTYFFEIYPYVYEFQADISNMAGETDVTLAFANTGEDPITGFSATDNLYLDNVCIYVSDEAAQLPGPVDTDPVLSPESVENWTCPTCSQIPGILYNYGLSVYYLEEMYNNGVSIWDYSGWVPWLGAALWVNAGSPLACWLLGLWCWWLGLFQYLLWELLNWFHWGRRSLEAFWVWAITWGWWGYYSASNVADWAWQTLKAWLPWLPLWLESVFTKMLQIFGKGLNWVGNHVTPLLGKIIQDVSNWFIDGWNKALKILSVIFSEILDNFGKLLAWLAPLLEKLGQFLAGLSLLWMLLGKLLSFFEAVLGLLGMLIAWIWENIFAGLSLPFEFYDAFNQGIADSSFSYLLSCSDQNFWCSLLAGFQLVNESAGQNIIYPAVIVLIIVTTIWIFWNDIKALFSIKIQ